MYTTCRLNTTRLTKVFIDLSKVVHGVSVGQLEPGNYKKIYIKGKIREKDE